MRHRTINTARAALCLAALLCLCAAPAAAGARYDVLYLWRPDQAGINSARASVAHILGPAVTRRLRVVRQGGRYGLVYVRRGDLGSAAAVARSHARMLTPRGLQAPVPILAQDWEAQRTEAPAKAVPAKPAPQPKPAEKPRPEQPAAPAAPASASAADTQAAQPFAEKLDQYLKHLRQAGAVKSDERTAWAVYDLADNTKLAGINEDMLLQTASLVKPFVALAYFHEVAQGRQQYTDTARRRMEEMIRDSDNAAADWFMRLLGGPAAVQRILANNYGEIARGLSLVEYIPHNGHTYRNKATVQNYTAFLNALWDEKLPDSAEIKRVMGLPKRNRLYTGTQGVPQGTEVYDKTGTTSHLCGDMGILVALRNDGKRFPYIVIGLIQKSSPASRYFAWMHKRGDVIRHVSAMAYEEIAARHHFRDFNAAVEKTAAEAQTQTKVAAPEAAGTKPAAAAQGNGS